MKLSSLDRPGFKAPVAVSDSLTAAAGLPVAYLFDGWENRFDFDDPMSIMECSFPPGPYSVPYINDIEDRARELDDERFRLFYASATRKHLVEHWDSRYDLNAWNAWKPYPTRPRDMTADEVIAHSLYNDGRMSDDRHTSSVMRFDGCGAHLYEQASEMNPLLFSNAVAMLTHDAIWSPDHADVKIGELLHIVSRCPNAFSLGMGGKRDSVQGILGRRSELYPAAGEAWAAFALLGVEVAWEQHKMLAIPHERFTDTAVELAGQLVELGLEVQEVQPYVTHFGSDIELIRGAVSNGVDVDMLDALRTQP